MSQTYKKSCMYCKKEIEMSDRAAGQWLPYELEDGNLHECKVKREKTKATNNVKSPAPEKEEKPQLKNILEAQVFMEGIDARLKRVEKMLFIEGK